MSPLFLKILAMLSMLTDHIGFTFFPQELTLRAIGRIAMPVYCFLLVQSFFYTRSRKRYAAGLLLFYLLSEIPFDWLVSGQAVYWGLQNVFLTLLIGFLCIWAMDWLLRQELPWKMLLLLPLAAAIVVAKYSFCDYTWRGVVCIAVFYVVEKTLRWLPELDKRLLRLAGAALAAVVLFMGMFEDTWRWFSLLSVPFLTLYNENGLRARKPVWKYAFYWFYPVHITLLCIIRALL